MAIPQCDELDWQSLDEGLDAVRRVGLRSYRRLLDDYYYTAAQDQFLRMVHQLNETQLLLEAGGLSCLPLRRLLDNAVRTDRLALFLWRNERGGWASLARGGRADAIMWTAAVSSHIAWLEEQFSCAYLAPDRPLDATIASYSKMLQRARHHLADDRGAEAFLHFVIALDLLFGHTDATTEKLSSRAAAVVHRPCDSSYDEVKSRLKRLYRLRSNYVHDAVEPPTEQIREVDLICTEVLWALLRLRHRSTDGTVSGSEAIDGWRKRLDVVAAQLEAEVDPTPSELQSLGIGSGRSIPPTSFIQTILLRLG